MQIGNWLEKNISYLEKSAISTARLDCLVLLGDVIGKDRSWLLAHPEYELESSKVRKLESMMKRRAKHEPLAYIRGKSEFYGRWFSVNAHTLEPRPETETMIELLLKQVKSQKLTVESVVDIGTGSGCIAITAKLELPTLNVIATDIDKECLKIAAKNARRHSAKITITQANLLKHSQKVSGRTLFENVLGDSLSGAEGGVGEFIICANLPYVPDSHTINLAARFEPPHAIFGGSDGLELYREMFDQIDSLSDKPRFVLTESLPPQHQDLEKIANSHGYKITDKKDFIQVFLRY